MICPIQANIYDIQNWVERQIVISLFIMYVFQVLKWKILSKTKVISLVATTTTSHVFNNFNNTSTGFNNYIEPLLKNLLPSHLSIRVIFIV